MSKKLIVQECDDHYMVKDTIQGSTLPMDLTMKTIEVDDVIWSIVQKALNDGKSVGLLKTNDKNVKAIDLIIDDPDEIEILRRRSLREIQDLMQNQIFCVGLIDSFDFLESYMKMLNKNILITDENREDMYFKVIEQAQDCQEPEPLKENSTFEDEQAYITQKNKYEQAQDTLKTLESYLNGYDKLKKVTFINKILTESRDRIREATTADEINEVKQGYIDDITNLFYKNTSPGPQ